jgi:beta-1,4-mannosyl-glycoprotein beta-1,4-N-acetylglucosaminyltransferase
MMKIFDAIIFNDELDILEIRLKYLSSHVDHFIIVESDHTFQGNPKPYHLQDNWERFKPWHDKIIHLPIEQDPSQFEFKQVDRYSPENGPFRMEEQCRNALHLAKEFVHIAQEDLAILSDVDEIWHKDFIPSYTLNHCFNQSLFVAMSQQFFGYKLNMQNTKGPDVNWKGSVVAKGSTWNIIEPQRIRDSRNNVMAMNNAGWHFSWMGSIENKIKSFAHVEFNRPEILDSNAISQAIEEGKDVLQRPGVSYEKVDMNVFPPDLKEILTQYPHLIKN